MFPLRLLAALACLLGLALPLTPAAWASTADDSDQAQGLVIVGASGLTLSDLSPDRTPHLWSVVEDGAVANLSVRTLTPATCAASGWLSLGAAARMHSVDLTPDWMLPLLAQTSCPRMIDPVPTTADDSAEHADPVGPADEAAAGSAGTPIEMGPAVFEEFGRVLDVNEGAGYSAAPGMATRPRSSEDPSSSEEWCTAAYGRGAGYAAADADGRVPQWAPVTGLFAAGADGSTSPLQLDTCGLTLIDAGTAADPMWEPNAWYAWNPHSLGRTRTGQIARLDERVGQILEQVPTTSDVVIAGLGDMEYPSRLRAVLATGPSYEPGTLRSSSTRQPGLVQLTDLLPAALRSAGMESQVDSPAAFLVDPADTDATSAEDEAEERISSLVAETRKAATVHRHAQTFSIFLDVVHYALTIALAILFLVPVARRLRVRENARIPLHTLRTWGAWACFTIGLLPMASFLAGIFPWGRTSHPAMGLLSAIVAGTVILVGVAVAGPWRRTWAGRVAAVSLVSTAVLVLDVAVGSRLQFNALMGYNPIVAGRFYGLGNQGAALFLVSALLGLGIVAARLVDAGRIVTARLLVAAVAITSVVVLGNPSWGAKFGGTVAALVGFTVLLLALFKIRVNLVRLALIGAGALTLIVGVAGLDYLRPPAERSHFGNFFAQALDGQVLEVISRKLEANLRIIVINPGLAIIVPLAIFTVLFSMGYLRRWDATARFAQPWANTLPRTLAHPTVHAGFAAAAIALGVGLVITDSGVAVPATGAMMLVPLLVALSVEPPTPGASQ